MAAAATTVRTTAENRAVVASFNTAVDHLLWRPRQIRNVKPSVLQSIFQVNVGDNTDHLARAFVFAISTPVMPPKRSKRARAVSVSGLCSWIE
jgi:hypothetical protein